MKSGNCELNQKINASDGCNLFTVKIGRRWSSGHDGGIIFSKLAGKICFHHSLYLCGAIKIYSNKGKTKIQSTPPEPFYSKHHCVQQTRRRIPAKKNRCLRHGLTSSHYRAPSIFSAWLQLQNPRYGMSMESCLVLKARVKSSRKQNLCPQTYAIIST